MHNYGLFFIFNSSLPLYFMTRHLNLWFLATLKGKARYICSDKSGNLPRKEVASPDKQESRDSWPHTPILVLL
jgi:hypothetical protein